MVVHEHIDWNGMPLILKDYGVVHPQAGVGMILNSEMYGPKICKFAIFKLDESQK